MLLIPLLALIATVGFIGVSEAQRTPEWQQTLNGYLAHTSANGVLLARVSAWRPDQFDSSAFPVVDYGHFGYRSGPVNDSEKYAPPTPAWATKISSPSTVRNDDLSTPPNLFSESVALPSPPKTVQCVLIGDKAQPRLLFINYYSDSLWQYGWVIHDGGMAPFTHELNALLQQIDCRLAM